MAAIETFGDGYSFINVADTSTAAPAGTFGNFYGLPAIHGATVAFQATYPGGSGVFTAAGGQLTTIAKTGDVTELGLIQSLTNPVIGDQQVSFYGAIGGAHGFYSSDGTSLAAVALTEGAGSPGFDTFDPLCLAMSGTTVAFRADGDPHGVYISSDGMLSEIVASGDSSPLGTLASFGRPAISGQMVAVDVGAGVIKSDGTTQTVIAKVGNPAPQGTFTEFATVSINGSKVAFQGEYSSSLQRGIFVGDGGPLTTIAKSGDASSIGELRRMSNPSIAGDQVAFSAIGDGEGILIGDGGALTTVIQSGDALFGSVVQGVSFSRFGLDPAGSGHLCFRYNLSDGRSGIAMAIPDAPSSTDFDMDGDVDGADFLRWQRGESPRVIGLQDLANWRANFGAQASASTASTAVPEPMMITMAGLALVAIVQYRRLLTAAGFSTRPLAPR